MAKQKSKKHKGMSGLTGMETGGNLGKTLLATGLTVLAGVSGFLAGAYMGKGAVPIGVVATGAAHFADQDILAMGGAGMVLAGMLKAPQTTTSTTDGKQDQSVVKKYIQDGNMKVKTALDALAENTMVDKVIAKFKKQPQTPQGQPQTEQPTEMNGLGNVSEMVMNKNGIYEML